MEKPTYITETERMRCQRVADTFFELYETDNIVVLDAGRYGFVMLEYYAPKRGFDDVYTFTNSRDLFENLWMEWLNTQLLILSKGTPMSEMDYEDIYKWLPREKQKELINKKRYFAEKAGLDINQLSVIIYDRE